MILRYHYVGFIFLLVELLFFSRNKGVVGIKKLRGGLTPIILAIERLFSFFKGIKTDPKKSDTYSPYMDDLFKENRYLQDQNIDREYA